MKKLLLCILVSASLIACKNEVTNTESANKEPKPVGFEYDSTANIDNIKASFEDMATYDTTSYKAKYADTASFYDNGKKMTLAENVNLIKTWESLGIKVKISKIWSIWESRYTKDDKTEGITVLSYITVTLTKGDKSVDVIMNQNDDFVNGKIVRELLFYDPTNINNLMK